MSLHGELRNTGGKSPVRKGKESLGNEKKTSISSVWLIYDLLFLVRMFNNYNDEEYITEIE